MKKIFAICGIAALLCACSTTVPMRATHWNHEKGHAVYTPVPEEPSFIEKAVDWGKEMGVAKLVKGAL